MAVVETLNLISETMDKLIDFAVNDEFLSYNFENYLIENEIEAQKQSEINALIIEYILDGKMQDNKRVLDYYLQKNPNCNEKVINSLKKSFISVFKINKILKNAYKCTCLANEQDFELIPLVKMTNLRSIGLYDFIKARMIEMDNTFYLLEIFDCYGQFREYNANIETIRCLVKYPESQTMYNEKKLEELKNSVKFLNEKFIKIFNTDEIVVTNTLADDLIEEFNSCIDDENFEITSSKYKNIKLDYGYFELENKDEDFIKNAQGGFSNAQKPYDIGFYIDNNLGLFIVPFLGTVNYILEKNAFENIENANECIKNFITSNKVSPNLLIKKSQQYKNFINIINKVFAKNFEDIREVIGYFKPDWIYNDKFSPTIVLYNSKTFENIINLNKNEEIYT